MALNYSGTNSFTLYGSTGLGTATAWSSTAVPTGTSNNTVDVLVQVTVVTGTTTTTGNRQAVIYAYASPDGTNYGGDSAGSGTVYDNVTGTANVVSISTSSPSVLKLLGTLPLINTSNAVTCVSQPMSLAAAFGGTLPKKYGIVIYNDTGQTTGAVSATYTEVYYG